MPQKPYSKYVVLITLCLLFIGLTPPARAEDIATIHLKSGTEYRDVPIKVDDIYKTIEIVWEGKKLNISYSDIESISDKDGKDITERVLGRAKKSSNETWLSKDSEQVRVKRAKPWNAIISAGGNYSIPSGDYYDGIDAGIGFDCDIRVAVSNRIAVQCLVSRSGAKVSDDLYIVSHDPNISIMDQDISIDITRYEVAVNVFEPISRVKEYPNYFYAFSGLGLATHTMTTKATLRNISTDETLRIEDKNTKNKFAMVFGLGFLSKLSKHAGIDFSGTMDMIPVDAYTSSGEKTADYAYLFDFKLSAIYMF
jgi:hypothetical protein